MRYVLLLGVVGLGLALDLTVLVATTDNSFASFDPHHPATFLPIVAYELHKFASAAGDLVRDLLTWWAAP